MTDADPAMKLERLAEEIIQPIVERLSRGLDEINSHVDERTDRALMELRGRLAAQDRRYEDLAVQVHHATAVMAALIQDIRSQMPPDPERRPLPIPGENLPRPQELDAACAADPAQGLQQVIVNVYGRRVTYSVQGGSDPDRVWAGICASIARQARRRWAHASGDPAGQPPRV